MKQKSSQKDRIKGLLEQNRGQEAIEILQGRVNRSHSNIDRRQLAQCQLELQEYIAFFSTFHTIENKTKNDLAMRDQAIDGLIGQSDQVSLERVNLISSFALNVLRSGSGEEAGIILIEAVHTWLKLSQADQDRKEAVENFQALLHAQDWGQLEGFGSQSENFGKLQAVLAEFCPAEAPPNAHLDQALDHLKQAEQAWQNDLVSWKLFQIHLQRKEMPEAIEAYRNYLKRKPDDQPLLADAPTAAALALDEEDLGQIVLTLTKILANPGADEEQEKHRLVLLLECFGSLLEKGQHMAALRNILASCPRWMFQGERRLLPVLLIESWLEDDLQQIEWIEKFFDAYQTRWPENGAMHFTLARYFYQKGDLAFATPIMKKAVALCPSEQNYKDWMQTLEHLELVSLRLPSEQYKHLTEQEAAVLRKCIGVPNFADIGRLSASCGITVGQARAYLHDFLITRMISKVEEPEEDEEYVYGFVTVGGQIYKIHPDLLTYHAREGGKDRLDPEYTTEMDLWMNAGPDDPEVSSNIFATQDEKRVYAALQRVFSDPRKYTISINMNISILFASDWAEKTVSLMKMAHFYQTSVDFCVADNNGQPLLAVEVDGGSHSNKKTMIKDIQKNMLFEKAGIPFLRIYNPKKDVFYLAEEIENKLSALNFFKGIEADQAE